MSRGTLDPASLALPSLTGLSPSPAGLSRTVLLGSQVEYAVRTPECSHSGLGSSGSARRYSRNHCCFLFLRLLRCFSSPGSPPHPIRAYLLIFRYGYMESVHVGFPIQRSVDHRIFAPPHGFSQLITSFVGSQCQGIRPALFPLNLSLGSPAFLAGRIALRPAFLPSLCLRVNCFRN